MKHNLLRYAGFLALGIFLGASALAPSSAEAQLIVPGDLSGTTGSWNWSFSFVGPWDFDELVWVYRPDLDMGGGRFEAPFGGIVGGLGAPGWGLTGGNPNTMRMAGPSLDGIAPNNSISALGVQYFLDGDASQTTGFNLGIFEGGSYVLGLQFRVGANFTVFEYSGISEADFDASAAAVPEPGSLALLGLGISALVGGARRRRNRA